MLNATIAPLPYVGEGTGEGGQQFIQNLLLTFRRELRKNSSDAERKIWTLLRSRQLQGFKFRRQHRIGKYIADFCCLRSKLIIELDGGQHMDRAEYDFERTQFLESEGFQVLRFWNHEVFKETEAVVNRIYVALTTPHPRPLPRRERV